MSRRTQIVRSVYSAGPASYVTPEGVFTWNAMLGSSSGNDIEPADEQILATAEPRHTSLGVEVDFDLTSYPEGRIRVPRHGIYSISGGAVVVGETDGLASLIAYTTGPFGAADIDTRLVSGGRLHAASAGWPLLQGDTVWLSGHNSTDATVTFFAGFLSVTYEAELGEVLAGSGG